MGEETDDGVAAQDQHHHRSGQVVAMITAVLGIGAGLALIVVVAIVVGIVDAANASSWRQVAAERRRRWEEDRMLELQGVGREVEGRAGG
jgi:hypothetical protein